MVDASNEVMERTDEAVALVLAAQIAAAGLTLTKADGDTMAATIVRGFESDVLELPYVDVSCVEADPRDSDFANFDVSLVVEVRTHAEDIPRSEHRRLAGLVGAVLWRKAAVDDETLVLHELLSAAVEGYTAMYWTPGRTSRSVDGAERVTKFEGTVFARCS